MDFEKLISKTAVDINNRRLGEIIRIDRLPGKTIKVPRNFAVIIIRKVFKKDLQVPIEITKGTEIRGNNVKFDITLEEFKEETNRIETLMEEKRRYKGEPYVYSSQGLKGRLDPFNMGDKPREKG